MPTVLTHSLVAVAMGRALGNKKRFIKIALLGILCSVIPDVDVIGYNYLYVPYGHFLGHRGFFHSPFFAALLSFMVVALFFRPKAIGHPRWQLLLYFFLAGASHGILDAMTDGGRGIALLSPFSNERYFLPWTPIAVSPLGIKAFFSQRGLTVLMSEFLWVWLPTFLLVAALPLSRKFNSKGKV